MEAASDARYLRDLLQRMIQAKVFLDSENLSDLRDLFDAGVRRSDVLVVLCTASIALRPWCLCEILEATRAGVPVLPLVVDGKGFSRDKLTDQLASLEETLTGGAGMREVREYLLEAGATFDELKSAVAEALAPEAATGGIDHCHSAAAGYLHVRMHGTDNQITADATDLIEEAARRCGKPLEWTGRREPQSPMPGRRWDSVKTSVAGSAALLSKAMVVDGASAKDGGWGRVRHAVSGAQSLCWSQTVFLACEAQRGGAHARMLQSRIQGHLGRPVLVMSPADPLAGCEQSSGLLVVQTAAVLCDPRVLVQLYDAVERSLPIVPIHVDGGGYDFDEARSLLRSLASDPCGEHLALAEDRVGELASWLGERGTSVAELADALVATLPNILSLSLRPHGSENHLEGLVADIAERLSRPPTCRRKRRAPEVARTWAGHKLLLDQAPAEARAEAEVEADADVDPSASASMAAGTAANAAEATAAATRLYRWTSHPDAAGGVAGFGPNWFAVDALEGRRLCGIAGARSMVAVLAEGGELWCWANPEEDEARFAPRRQPTRPRALVDSPLRLVALQAAALVAVATDGSLLHWDAEADVPTPMRWPGEAVEVQQLAAGASHALALSAGAAPHAFSWGCNEDGQLGLGDFDDRSAPEQMPLADDVTVAVVACGGDVSLLLLADGTALVQIACGGRHCVAATEDGRVVSWGSVEGGRLGRAVRQGASEWEHAAPAVVDELEERRVTVVSAAANHSLALDKDGRLWMWGSLSDGERHQPEEIRPPADDEHFARHFVQACATEWYTLVGVTVAPDE